MKIIGKWRWHSLKWNLLIFLSPRLFSWELWPGKIWETIQNNLHIIWNWSHIWYLKLCMMTVSSTAAPILTDFKPPLRISNDEGMKMWEPPYIWFSQYIDERQTSQVNQKWMCKTNTSNTIHVWYVYLHLVNVYSKCKQIYQSHGCYTPHQPSTTHPSAPSEVLPSEYKSRVSSPGNAKPNQPLPSYNPYLTGQLHW